ncbi:MAG: c-type cytochrome [Solimonas sp.]
MLLCLAALAVAAPALADEAMLERGGCVGCHRVNEKLVGPPLRAVAAKYRNVPDAAAQLFASVREGSEGVWGDIPMPPKAPEQLSDADLQATIAWILQLQ